MGKVLSNLKYMKRVSMIVWNDFRNDARVLKEAETLQSAGYEVTVFALHTPGVTQQKETLASGVKVVRVLRSPLWFFRRHWHHTARPVAAKESGRFERPGRVKLLGLLVSRGFTHLALAARMILSRPAVIHAHDVNTLATAWVARVVTHAKLVYDAHEISTSREGYSSFRRMTAFIEGWLMPKAQGTITTTDARAKFFARAYGVARPTVLQNRPRYTEVERTETLRETLGITDSAPIVLYQGGVQQGRGLALLVRAAQKVEGAYFVFVGGGRLVGELEQLTQELGIEKRVRFIPTVSLDALPAYTASADIGVQPIENTCLNHFTTDSNKLFEYVMAGLPVVATQLPEIRQVVNGFELGLLVPSGDLDALAEAIQRLVSDGALRARYATNARAASERLSWEEQEQKLVELYQRL